MLSAQDAAHMARAIRLAERGRFTTTPNPRVGAVIVKDDLIIGEGWHMRAGEAHAEIAALEHAGEQAKGATLYVSLEPCSHRGRTAPCVDAVIAAGISRVVYGHEDPNPLVSAAGIEKLRAAGLEVEGPLLETEARAVNPGYIKRMSVGRPFVRIKLAMSLDGRTAMPDKNSFWITGPKARADVQRLRGKSCAVITGWQTVLQDAATLTSRPEEFGVEEPGLGERQPLRVLVDSQLRLPQDARFFSADGDILVANLSREESSGSTEYKVFPKATDSNGEEHVDIERLLDYLAERGCNEVLVEAGAGLAAAFFRLGIVDELVVYMAPKLMGSEARPMFDLPLWIMDEALPVRFSDVRMLGRDIRFTAIPETE